MNNIIPINYQLGGRTFNIEYVNDKLYADNVGFSNITQSIVIIANDFRGSKNSEDYKELTFCHELVHTILLAQGKTELSDNEEFVEGFANLLHQYLKTAKFKNE